MKRIVVKIGSNVITRPDAKIDVTRISAIVDQTAWLRRNGYEVILVSSGAVACGRGVMNGLQRRLDPVSQRQLFSAIGQAKLVNLYYDLFREYGIHVGQVLTMKESFATRREYLNQRACMDVMLQAGVVPVVNENDTVSVTELMFTDNDELSGLIASMMDAETLVLLSNIDGIYDGSPSDPRARIINKVESGRDMSEYIQPEKSGFGRGGMTSKCATARRVADEGIRVIVANGKRDNILIDLVERPEQTPFTEFLPNPEPASGVKKWIAHSGSFAKGCAVVNANAAKALTSDAATSLLMVGVSRIEGDFDEGDIIGIFDPTGKRIAVGRTSFSSDEARRHLGEHGLRPLVHYDYLYLENLT